MEKRIMDKVIRRLEDVVEESKVSTIAELGTIIKKAFYGSGKDSTISVEVSPKAKILLL
ncbi:hypothetical protein FRC11_007963, partial [Ceratobasidium sp. 423]